MHLLFGHGEVAGAHVLQRVELDLLEPHDLPVHAHLAVDGPCAGERDGVELFQHLHLRVVDGVGEVVALDPPHEGFAGLVVEPLHLVLARLVQVDGLLVQRGQGAGEIHFGDHHRLAGGVHHHEVVAGDGAQADGVGRIGVRSPVPGAAGVVQEAGFFQEAAQLGVSWGPNFSPSRTGSSKAAHFRWLTRISRLSGLMWACSGDCPKK